MGDLTSHPVLRNTECMTTATLTDYQQHLLAWANKDAKSRTQSWPGFPMSQVPLVSAPDVHKMVDMGYLELVHITKPGPTGEIRTLTYVAPRAFS